MGKTFEVVVLCRLTVVVSDVDDEAAAINEAFSHGVGDRLEIRAKWLTTADEIEHARLHADECA